MGVAELKFFKTEHSLTSVKNQSKSLNPFSLTADLFQQKHNIYSATIKNPKSRFIKIKKLIYELMFNIYSR